jgi:hypothetical protein
MAIEKRMPNKKTDEYFMADCFRKIKMAWENVVSNVNNLNVRR